MRKQVITVLTISAIGLISLLQFGCSAGDTTSKIEPPKTYPSDLVMKYSQLGNEGYQALETNLDSAVALFTEQKNLAPEGKWGYYNLACAYGRNGQVDQAMAWLDSAVAGGWDDAAHLQQDTDLQSLVGDPRFDALLKRVEETQAKHDQIFAGGLPTLDAPEGVVTEEALNEWAETQQRELRLSGSIWYGYESTSARMIMEAKRLAALSVIHADSFDYPLERIIATCGLQSPYEEKWGPICGTIMSEADAYLEKHPTGDGANEAAYRGAMAAIMENGVAAVATPEGAPALARAEQYRDKIDPTAHQHGAAEAWIMAATLAKAGDARADLYPQLKTFLADNADNDRATNVTRILMAEDVVRASWPIPINGVDIDGKKVSLADYKGKVVLVDFWATWCPPCRAELPFIKQVYEKYNKQGFEILSISLDYANRTDQKTYRDWITENGMKWRHIYDELDWKGPLVGAFSVSSIPSPFLIGKDGSLAAMHEECRGMGLEQAVRTALGL